MKAKICPTCKRPIMLDRIEDSFTRLQRRIYRAVAESGEVGLSKWQVLEQAYFDAPDGGPRSPNIVRVTVYNINKVLHGHRLKIRADARRDGNYRLEACE